MEKFKLTEKNLMDTRRGIYYNPRKALFYYPVFFEAEGKHAKEDIKKEMERWSEVQKKQYRFFEENGQKLMEMVGTGNEVQEMVNFHWANDDLKGTGRVFVKIVDKDDDCILLFTPYEPYFMDILLKYLDHDNISASHRNPMVIQRDENGNLSEPQRLTFACISRNGNKPIVIGDTEIKKD